MKSVISTFYFTCLFALVCNSQTVKNLPEFKTYDKINYTQIFITKDNEYILSTPHFDFVFDQNGQLIKQVKPDRDNAFYDVLSFYKSSKNIFLDKETDIFYAISGNNGYTKSTTGSILVEKYNTQKCVIDKERIEYPDAIKPSRNLASPILNDYSPYSQMTTMDSSGNILHFELYMSISNQTHPNLNNFENDVFHTFVHIVKFSPDTKEVEISNGLIDKIELERKNKNSAYGEIIGVIGSKLVIKYTSYKSEEIKGLYDATGSAKNHSFAYWTYDVNTKEEVKILEYTTDFPENMEQKDINEIILNNKIYSDHSWTEKATDGQGYVSNHKILILENNGDTSWVNFNIPDSLLRLQYSEPSNLNISIGKDGSLVMSNLLKVEVEKMDFRKLNFVYFINEEDKIDLKVFSLEPNIVEVKPVNLFSHQNLEDEDIASIYSSIRSEKELKENIGNCNLMTHSFVRIIDNEIKLFSWETAYGFSKKKLKKSPDCILINSFPLE